MNFAPPTTGLYPGQEAKPAAEEPPPPVDDGKPQTAAQRLAALKARSDDLLGRWLGYLQTGAPGAVVLVVLSKCDALLPAGSSASGLTPAALEAAAAEHVEWLGERLAAHGEQLPKGAPPLCWQSPILCACSASGGEKSLAVVRARLEMIVSASPPLLPSLRRNPAY